MKKVILFVFIVFTMFSCVHDDIRKDNLTRPGFDITGSFKLEQTVLDFFASYNLIRPGQTEPVVTAISYDWFNAYDFKLRASNGYEFDLIKTDVEFRYKLFYGDDLIMEFYQLDLPEIVYQMDYNGGVYTISEEIRKSYWNQIIDSAVFTIKDSNGLELVHIFKEFHYFANIVDIITDGTNKRIDPVTITAVSVIMNESMKERFSRFK